MKKLLALALLTLSLGACAQPAAPAKQTSQETTTTAKVEQTITVNVKKDGEPISGSPFTLTFKDGDKLLTVMKEQMQIVEKDGFVSAINGIEQEPANQKYWLFDVNGEMSQVGANQVDLKQGDVIDWKLEAFKQ